MVMRTMIGYGRTSIVYCIGNGLVCKTRLLSAGSEELDAEFKNAFVVEELLLKRLGVHPRIVRYVYIYNNANPNLSC